MAPAHTPAAGAAPAFPATSAPDSSASHTALSQFVGIKVVSNSDVTTIAWQTVAPIPGCLGFALERQLTNETAAISILPNHVGFKGIAPAANVTSRPSSVWPIQRFVWSDFDLTSGQRVRYRVRPLTGTPAALAAGTPSVWSDWVIVGTGQTPGLSAWFNRGMVSTQFLSRQASTPADFHTMLQTDIQTAGNANRNFLAGPLRPALLALLAQAKTQGVTIYASLFELNDCELLAALKVLGDKACLLLGSGAFSSATNGKPAEPDENAAVRTDLKANSQVQVFDRLVTGNHFAHNKFVVFMDAVGAPQKVWTGSTNWTVTGLCTQVNNGLLIESAAIAQSFLDRWHALKAAGNLYPATLAQAGATPGSAMLGQASVQAWHAPCAGFADIQAGTKLIKAAQQGVLFLMFNPGSGKNTPEDPDSLEQVINALDPDKFFIHGVVNQQQTDKTQSPTLKITSRGSKLTPVTLSEITPAQLAHSSDFFHQEFRFSPVMIHSKIVVLDPFGDNPVVMTGSHNMGPKASRANDDNLVIIRHCPGLATEYAVNILGVFTHYKWLYTQSLHARTDAEATAAKAALPTFDGNQTDDTWQTRFTTGPNLREIQFWFNRKPLTP